MSLSTIRSEMKTMLEGIGYYVQDAELLSLSELMQYVSQIKDDQYPHATISFGDSVDTDNGTDIVGYIDVEQDFHINTIYNATRKELPPIRESETRKIRDAIYDYLQNSNRSSCKVTVDSIRRAFLPSTSINQSPAGGLAIKIKLQYSEKERS